MARATAPYFKLRRDMKYLVLKTTDPNINLATEEYLFENSEEDIFMLWQNDNTVVIGKNQNAYAEVDVDFVKYNDIKLVRRIIGGGAVYHGRGNVIYSCISSKKNAGALDFAYFTAPIINALHSLGIEAELSGRNDLICNGKKFSGNAQHANEKRVLHHGTLLFDSDLNVLSGVLKVDPEKIASKAISSTKSRVTNLKTEFALDISAKQFMTLILEYVKNMYSAEEILPPSIEDIKGLCDRYTSHEWIYSDKKYLTEYTARMKKRYSYGIVDVYLDLSADIIKKIRISGDFFGTRSTDELERLLENCPYRENDILDRISSISIGEYIFGMDSAAFVEHILRGEK